MQLNPGLQIPPYINDTNVVEDILNENLPERDFGPKNSLTAFEAIQDVPQEILWQANFDSVNTQQTYGFALKQFMGFLGIKTT